MVSFKLPYQASLAEFRSITANRPMGEGQRERKSKHFDLGHLFSRFSLIDLSHCVSISCFNHLEIFKLESVSKSVYIDMCQSQYMIVSLYCTSPQFSLQAFQLTESFYNLFLHFLKNVQATQAKHASLMLGSLIKISKQSNNLNLSYYKTLMILNNIGLRK